MRRFVQWVLVAALVGLLALLGHQQWHQRHMNIFLVIGYLATVVVMLSFFWVARDQKERGAALRDPEALAIDRDDQNF